MNTNRLAKCTHPVPDNDLGIFAMHSYNNEPLPAADQTKLFNGPLANLQDDLNVVFRRVTDESAYKS